MRLGGVRKFWFWALVVLRVRGFIFGWRRLGFSVGKAFLFFLLGVLVEYVFVF